MKEKEIKELSFKFRLENHKKVNLREGLKLLRILILELRSSNSVNFKLSILKKYSCNDFIKKVLFYTYNPYYKYGLRSVSCKKKRNLTESSNNPRDNPSDPNFSVEDWFLLLDLLRRGKLRGNEGIKKINSVVNLHVDYSEEIFGMLDKNLKTRISKIINKVFVNLIPTFEVMLAKSYDSKISNRHIKFVKSDSSDSSIGSELLVEDKHSNHREDWFMSQKLDGVRCIAVVSSSGVKLYSRFGNELEGLSIIGKEVGDLCLSLDLCDVVFDGEICLLDSAGKENFQFLMKELHRKDHEISNVTYKVFDLLSVSEFESRLGLDSNRYSCRYDRLKEVFSGKYGKSGNSGNSGKLPTLECNHLSLLEQILIKDEKHLEEFCNSCWDLNWEGVMVRKDVLYEGKRTNNLLKIKKFKDREYVVKNVIFEVQRFIDKESGLETERELLSSVEIEYKGNTVNVGSGFSLSDRIRYSENREELIGKEIVVQYFEETLNKEGKYSLRFPTIKYIYEKGRLL